jgi:hypothetical protein
MSRAVQIRYIGPQFEAFADQSAGCGNREPPQQWTEMSKEQPLANRASIHVSHNFGSNNTDGSE